MHPELFGAIVCQAPLLDMNRYTKLLAGASWMSEYGDPDEPDDWAYISELLTLPEREEGQEVPAHPLQHLDP